ncbi:hypothetical protein Hanom_Chr06g00563861 [Helianthus anomalus]
MLKQRPGEKNTGSKTAIYYLPFFLKKKSPIWSLNKLIHVTKSYEKQNQRKYLGSSLSLNPGIVLAQPLINSLAVSVVNKGYSHMCSN